MGTLLHAITMRTDPAPRATARGSGPTPMGSLPGSLLGPVVGALLVLITACGDAPSGQGGSRGDQDPPVAEPLDAGAPDVLVITLDTTRADRLGCYGDASALTPRIDALAAGGLVFDRAYAPAPITLPSHASLFTGAYPVSHGVRDNGIHTLADEADLVSEVLARRGWATAASVGSYVLDTSAGLDQGFERYASPAPTRLGATPELVSRLAPEVVDEAVDWLRSRTDATPAFLWVHLFDPHEPLRPPARLLDRLGDAYAAAIASCDEQIGRLLKAARARAGERGLHVVLTADHGEGLGEHGEDTHGILLHEATMRVPLIVHSPDLPAGLVGTRCAAPVSLVDVPATLLDLLDLPASLLPHAAGTSLLTTAKDPRPERALLVESHLPWHTHGWHPLEGVVSGDLKLVQGRYGEVFDLTRDPDELDDLSATRPDLLETLKKEHVRMLSGHPPLPWSVTEALDDLERERLAALGYTGGLSSADDLPDDAADPREALPDLDLNHEAEALLRQGRLLLGLDALPADHPYGTWEPERRQTEGDASLERARALARTVLSRHPHDPRALGTLALTELALGHTEAALAAFERHAEHDPRSPVTHTNLALCYEGLGRRDLAVRSMQTVLTLEPRYLAAYGFLIEHHIAGSRPERAAWWLDRALEHLPPEHPARADLGARRAALGEQLRALGRQPTAPPADEFPVTDLRAAGRRD